MLIASPSAWGQVLTNTSDGTLSAVVSFEVLMPGKSQIPAGEQLRFRVRSNSASGYRVEASASFSSSASAPVAGGASISASDIGIGITVVDTSAPGVLKPRLDAIAPGFNYNPEDFIATNGLTPYQGRSGGEATVADLLAGPVKILSGSKIANSDRLNADNFLTVTIMLAVTPQYLTPGNVNVNLSLRVLNGQ